VLRPDPELVHEDWLKLIEVDAVNSKSGREQLRGLEPDLVLLAGAPILRRKTIEIARVACINPHCGITPDFAGSSPFDWAIYERRFEDVGYTVHLVEPTVDSGPILHQERIAWDPSRPNGHLWPILAQGMYDRLAEIVRSLIDGSTLYATPQGPPRVNPPAGLFARLASERVRKRHADEIRRLFADRQA
jgi:methionyl-tRNA formyltransferase